MPFARESPASIPAWQRRALLAALSLLFACAFLILAEVLVRLTEIAAPSLRSLPLPAELAGLLKPDEELFWALRPNAEYEYRGVVIRTNALGLRAPELPPKPDGEFRILLLGESGSFGIGVPAEETFAARLERRLEALRGGPSYRVINAAVPAYSSFQSLVYLERRGVLLEPDLILFSHEFNDYIPTSLRDSSNTEIGLVRTDRQLYESRGSAAWRILEGRSALFRLVTYSVARRRLRQIIDHAPPVRAEQIGLPEIGVPSRLRRAGPGRFGLADLDERRLPTRVSPRERREILERLDALCRARGFALVVIHPSYLGSERHECVLTEFCRTRGVPMFEAREALQNADPSQLFLDIGHPTAAGHGRLADALFEFLRARPELLEVSDS